MQVFEVDMILSDAACYKIKSPVQLPDSFHDLGEAVFTTSVFISRAFGLESLSRRSNLPLEGLRTLTSRGMKRSFVKVVAGCDPWLWLPSQAAGVNCVNANKTREVADAHMPLGAKSHQQIPSTETSGTTWPRTDEDRPAHSHMPAAVPTMFTKAYDNNRVVCCFLQ